MAGRKAQARSLSDMLIGLTVVGLIGFFIFLFIAKNQGIEVSVEGNEIMRRSMAISNIIISSDKLCYSNNTGVHRGILDKQKLDDIQNNPEPLFSEISYPDANYSVKIVDLENDNEWIIGEDSDPVFKFSVSIRYSETEIDVGYLGIKFGD